MANPHKGEVALDIDGETYTVSLSVNAMCELEDKLDRPMADIFSDMEKMRMNAVRAIFWAALRDHHPETTLKRAGDLLALAGIDEAMKKISVAIQLAFPAASAASSGQGGAKANPRKAKG